MYAIQTNGIYMYYMLFFYKEFFIRKLYIRLPRIKKKEVFIYIFKILRKLVRKFYT